MLRRSPASFGTGTHTRKSINQEVSDKTGQDVLQPGEKAFYKATIHFTPTSVGEFFIEAVGGSGGYGQLDPWFSSSWQYRKKVTISGVSGAGTNYQMLLKIGESGGSTSTKHSILGDTQAFSRLSKTKVETCNLRQAMALRRLTFGSRMRRVRRRIELRMCG